MRVYRQTVDAFIKQTCGQDWSDEEIAAPFHSGTVIPPVTAVLPQVPEAEALLGAKASECNAIMRSGFPAADSELNYRFIILDEHTEKDKTVILVPLGAQNGPSAHARADSAVCSGCSGRAQAELRTCSGMLRNAHPRLRSRRQLLTSKH
jgi:hypothetical protein